MKKNSTEPDRGEGVTGVPSIASDTATEAVINEVDLESPAAARRCPKVVTFGTTQGSFGNQNWKR